MEATLRRLIEPIADVEDGNAAEAGPVAADVEEGDAQPLLTREYLRFSTCGGAPRPPTQSTFRVHAKWRRHCGG